MRKLKRVLSLTLAAGLLMSALVGCGSKDTGTTTDGTVTESQGSTEGEQASTNSGEDFELAVCIASEPETIDPALNTSVDGAIMVQHLFEGLMKNVDDGNGNAIIVEGQAKSYTVSEDGLVYTFTLRDDIKWSDGVDVTADDFVYTWQRLVDPETTADYCYMIDMVANANEIMLSEKDKSELGIKAIDPKTLEITLNNACPYFLEICAFPATYPVRQDIIEANGDQWTFEPSTYIGNGQYKMSKWEHNSYIMVDQNEHYYDVANLGPDRIKFSLMDDQNAMLASFNSNELAFIKDVPVDEVPSLVESGKLHVVDHIGTYYACFNNQKEPFNDVRVRKAFSLVIDRNYIVEQITRTGQAPASGYVPAGIYDVAGAGSDDFRTVGGDYYSVDSADYEKNCEEARALLAEAGYPNGEGFPSVEYLYNTSDNHKVIGEALQDMWRKELGVQVTLNNQDWNVFLDTRKNGDYQIARNGWIADYNDPISFLDMWLTGGGNNDAQYSNPDYDALIKQAKSTSVPEERMKAMHEAEDLMMGQDSALAPIYFYTEKFMFDETLQGLYHTPLGYFYFGYITKK